MYKIDNFYFRDDEELRNYFNECDIVADEFDNGDFDDWLYEKGFRISQVWDMTENEKLSIMDDFIDEFFENWKNEVEVIPAYYAKGNGAV